MDKLDIESSISNQYIDNTSSKAVRVIFHSGRSYNGTFLKNNQLPFNSRHNMWIFTIEDADIMVNGDDIRGFFPFKHQSNIKYREAANN